MQDASVGFIFKGKANARAAAELRSVIYAVTGDSGEVKQFEYIKLLLHLVSRCLTSWATAPPTTR